MRHKDLQTMGMPDHLYDDIISTIKKAAKERYFVGKTPKSLMKEIISQPEDHLENKYFGEIAKSLVSYQEEQLKKHPINKPIPYAVWGQLDELSAKQMDEVCAIPVAYKAAVMADNHCGYSCPIGGVLATYNSVLPCCVGVDISCRMRLSVLDTPTKVLNDSFSHKVDPLAKALQNGTMFGVGQSWKTKFDHPVMDMDWDITSVTKRMKDRAWSQMGTSGSGNHFVEFGLLTVSNGKLGIQPGTYVALLSHSGSRAVGSAVCNTYDDIAKSKLPRAYKQFKNLAWLSLDTQEGQEYWNAMNLMGEYATANHAIIHNNVCKLAGAEIIATVENHHNHCWKETHDGQEVYVHRKGATPAGLGVLGVIPGSMADSCFVVVGKGKPESLMSASHGAGRKMSRTEAKRRFNWPEWKSFLKQWNVRLLSAGLDEVPGSYKNIHDVMSAQTDLVDIVGEFMPRIVKMSDDGRSED